MTERAASDRERGRVTAIVPLVGWLLGMLLVFYPMFESAFSLVPGWPSHDPRLVNFMLEHRYRWLSADFDADLWSPPVFFPEEGITTYSEPVLAVAPFYALWRILGIGEYGSYQLWLLVIWTLNYLAGLVLLRRSFGVGLVAASVGAFIFAFGSSRVANLSKPHLIPYFFLVLALLAVFEVFRRPGGERRGTDWGWVGLFFLALVAQFYTAFYPFYFFSLAMLAALLWAIVLPGTRSTTLTNLRRLAVPTFSFALLAGLIVWPLAQGYLTAASSVGLRPFESDKLTQWFSWFLMGSGNWAYGWVDELPQFRIWSRSLHHNGLGFVTMTLALVGLVRARHRSAIQLVALVALTLFVLTLRIHDEWSLWRWLRVIVPGGEAIRAVARIGGLAVFPVAIGLAFFFDRRGGPLWRALLVVLALFCFAEQAHRASGFERDFVRWRVDRIAQRVPPDCRAFYLATTGGGVDHAVHDDAMWVSLETGIPTVNGRYGNVPPDWGLRRSHFRSPAERQDLERRLSSWLASRGLEREEVCWIEVDRERERGDWAERERS